MKSTKIFAYAIRGRVCWVSEDIFHIPIAHDLYRVHLLQNANGINQENCTDYIIESYHQFIQDKPILNPMKPDDIDEFQLAHLKIKTYVKLSQFVNYSYKASLPSVFTDEEDKIDMLAKSLIDQSNLKPEEIDVHADHIEKIILTKKNELKKRYIVLCHEIKSASSMEEMINVSYKVVYEGINV